MSPPPSYIGLAEAFDAFGAAEPGTRLTWVLRAAADAGTRGIMEAYENDHSEVLPPPDAGQKRGFMPPRATSRHSTQ